MITGTTIQDEFNKLTKLYPDILSTGRADTSKSIGTWCG